jgi:hypothetical protein
MKSSIIAFVLTATLIVFFTGCEKKTENKSNQQSTSQAEQPTVAQPEPAKQQAALQEEPKKAEAPVVPKERKITIPDSTQLQVNLTDSIQTNSNQIGDHFRGTLAQAVEISGKTIFPQGSTVDLVITQLVKGGTLKTSPEIGFTIDKITVPGGQTYKIVSDEYYDKGRSHTAREVGMIGGGAAAGAVVGALTGKKKGAIIGAAAGAAAGTGVAAATGRQNLVYGPGQTVTFKTTQPLSVTVPNH